MTTVDLTAAVDAAARAHFHHVQAQRRDAARLDPGTGEPWQWGDLSPADQHAYRSFVLPLVTAAAQVLTADLDDRLARAQLGEEP